MLPEGVGHAVAVSNRNLFTNNVADHADDSKAATRWKICVATSVAGALLGGLETQVNGSAHWFGAAKSDAEQSRAAAVAARSGSGLPVCRIRLKFASTKPQRSLGIDTDMDIR